MSAPVHALAPVRRRRRRWLSAAIVGVAAAGLVAGTARAATFGEAEGDNYTLPAGQTVDDNLFTAGNTVTIDGTVDGDLFAAGREVTINGTVTGNVFAAASRITLGADGTVNGDLFAGAGEIVVAGRLDGDLRGGGSVLRITDGAIGGEVMAGGYHVEVGRDATVERGIYVGGTQVVVDGRVGGDAQIGAGAIHLGGQIDGDATLAISPQSGGGPPPAFFSMLPNQVPITSPPTLAAGVDIDPDARVAGDLTVQAPSEPEVPDGVVDGRSGYKAVTAAPAAAGSTDDEEAPAEDPAAEAVRLAMLWLRRTLALIVLGLIALQLMPGIVRTGVDRLTTAPVASGLWGVVALLAAPLGVVLLALGMIVVSLVLGYVLLGHLVRPWLALSTVGGVALTAGLYLVVWLGFVCIAVAVGAKLGGWANLGERIRGIGVGALLVGAPLVALLMVLPVVGGPAKWVLAALGIGALVVPWLARWRHTVADGAAAPLAPAG